MSLTGFNRARKRAAHAKRIEAEMRARADGLGVLTETAEEITETAVEPEIIKDPELPEKKEAPKEKPISLMDLTKADLIKIAERGGLSVTDRMTKQQIADLITAHGAGD